MSHAVCVCSGMVGLAAAGLGAHVTLTDMGEVLSQLQSNVDTNSELISQAGGSATVSELDWKNPSDEVGRGWGVYCG